MVGDKGEFDSATLVSSPLPQVQVLYRDETSRFNAVQWREAEPECLDPLHTTHRIDRRSFLQQSAALAAAFV